MQILHTLSLIQVYNDVVRYDVGITRLQTKDVPQCTSVKKTCSLVIA